VATPPTTGPPRRRRNAGFARAGLLAKFLWVLIPLFLVLAIPAINVLVSYQLRDDRESLTARIGNQSARVAAALARHDAVDDRQLIRDLMSALAADRAFQCAALVRGHTRQTIVALPQGLGCEKVEGTHQLELPVDDRHNSLLVVHFTDEEVVTAERLQLSVATGVVVMAFLCAVVAATIGFRIIVSRPLKQFLDAIRATALTGERQRVPLQRGDELGRVIDAYNNMLAHDERRERRLKQTNAELDASQQELSELNRELEDRVRERTAELSSQKSRAEADEAYLRTVLATVADAIITADEDGTVRSFNAAAERLFGYRADEILGKNLGQLMPAPTAARHDEFLRDYASDGKPQVITHGRGVTGRGKDGREILLDAAISEMRHAGGRQFIGVLRDVTELKQREDQLRQAQKMEAVGQLTGGVAHDFNNLLTAIIGNLEMACLQLGEDDEVRPLIETASSAAERGATLTQHLLAFARRQPLAPERVDVGELLANMSTLLERTLGSDIEIALDVADGLWPVEVDASQLQNAILNLAINARDAMPDGGRLTISAGNQGGGVDNAGAPPDGGHVDISVADTGTGMTEETLKRSFEPFFTTKEVGRGSGLGLSMVFGFAKQSGGHASAESQPGQGTTIHLHLPRAAENCADAAADDAPSAPMPAIDDNDRAANGGGAHVLLVEDDEDVRTIAVVALKRAGHQVLAAADGEQALALLEHHPEIDLLFTDVLLPGGMTGRDIAMVARQRRPDIPVLFASGYTRETLSEQGRLLPGIDLLQKPYTPRVLVDRIARTLSADGSARQLQANDGDRRASA